jgi:hypothetical protein
MLKKDSGASSVTVTAMSQESEDFDYGQYLEGILSAQQEYTISTINNNQRALVGWGNDIDDDTSS